MTKARSYSAILILVLVTAAGCSKQDEPIKINRISPVVNDENCKPENIAKISDAQEKQAFASACLRRPMGGEATTKKAW